MPGVATKPKALVTAPFRGEGLTTLQRVADVVLDPWIDAPKLRLYKPDQLAGRTAGIVGLGAVGRATKWRLEGLGMKVIAYDPYNPEATHSLDDLLAEADVVSMHAIVTPETTGLIGAEQFARMQQGAIYI